MAVPIAMVAQISQGAEAKVWATTFLQRDTIIKQRFSKQYRHPVLDATLTMQRLKAEVRCMIRARKLGIFTPVPYFTEVQAASIYMERIDGVAVKHVRPQNAHVCVASNRCSDSSSACLQQELVHGSWENIVSIMSDHKGFFF